MLGNGQNADLPPGTYASRRDAVIDYFANRDTDPYYDRVGLIEIACKIYREHEPESYLPRLEEILADPHGDMFWMIPVTLVRLVGETALPDHIRKKFQESWAEYTPYRGDTENHWLMYYVSIYLMAQTYRQVESSKWFNGKSTLDNFEEASTYLNHWFAKVVDRGLSEFDSPHYLPFYVAPLALMYGHSKSAKDRANAKNLLDLLIADFAAESLNGIYVGAHSRVYPGPLLERWKNGSTSLASLLFGNCPFSPNGMNIVLNRVGYRPHGTAAIVALSGYEPDEILHAIATDRSEEYTHLERKRSRTRIRRHLPRDVDVCKTTFVCADYALGSIDGDLVQPIQQHSWEVQWVTDDPQEGFNIIFSLHPYWSEDEMATFFPEEPRLLVERVLNSEKPTYTSEDKWTGGSPYEKIFQSDAALIVLYEIPEDIAYQHVDAYFPGTLSKFVIDESGWIVCLGGRCLTGYYPLADYSLTTEENGDRRLRSSHGTNGAVVQTARLREFGTVDSFITHLRSHVPTLGGSGEVTYTSCDGTRMVASFAGPFILNGVEIDYSTWPLFESKFITCNHQNEITLHGGGQSRRLVFDLVGRSTASDT